MSALASYVEKYILNPAAPIDCEEDGNEETRARVTERVKGEEGVQGFLASRSKLRVLNAQTLSDGDPRYQGKKITRKDKEKISTYDPELEKYFLIEEDSAEESSDAKISSRKHVLKNEFRVLKKENAKEKVIDPGPVIQEDDFLRMAEEDGEDDFDNSNSESIGDDHFGIDADDFDDENDSEIDGDCDDNENEDDEKDDDDDVDDDDDDVDKEEINEKESHSIKTFSSDNSSEMQKGLAVKNQCSLFDSFFELRIGLQKVINGANQLPQFDTYRSFLNTDYPHYKENLQNARKAVKNLVCEILKLQELLLLQNKETQHIFTNKKYKPTGKTDEDITSSEEETEDVTNDDISEAKLRGKKRKVEEYGITLAKRYKAMIPYRDGILNKWHEKTKLLANQKSADKFGGFEISAVQQLKNILANKDTLIKRTQMHGISRGNTYKVLGKVDTKEESILEEHDPEIFDDGDFYSRMLEEVLKSKMSLSEDLTEVSRRWVDIQKLRKKAKRKVDTGASKGRKIRYEVMSKLQQFLAPCKPATMNDTAANQLFASLFCQSMLPAQKINTL